MRHLPGVIILALVVAIASVFLCNRWTSTGVEAFPDLAAHVAMFVEFPLGVSQKEFRVRVPAAWRSLQVHTGFRQNQNPRGEVNAGYFQYRFVARGFDEPQTDFVFWEEKLIRADLSSYGDGSVSGGQYIDAAIRATELLSRKYGRPAHAGSFSGKYSAGWDLDGMTLQVHARNSPPERGTELQGMLSIFLDNSKKYHEADGWMNRFADPQKGTGPVGEIYCRRGRYSHDATVATFHAWVFTQALNQDSANEGFRASSTGDGTQRLCL